MKGKRVLFVPQELDEARKWRKERSPQNDKIINKYSNTVWVNNALPVKVKAEIK